MTVEAEETLMRLPAVLQRTGLSRSVLYAAVKRGKFPPPVKLSERCAAWPASEVAQWIDARIKTGRAWVA